MRGLVASVGKSTPPYVFALLFLLSACSIVETQPVDDLDVDLRSFYTEE
jgi:hypothetical protein